MTKKLIIALCLVLLPVFAFAGSLTPVYETESSGVSYIIGSADPATDNPMDSGVSPGSAVGGELIMTGHYFGVLGVVIQELDGAATDDMGVTGYAVPANWTGSGVTNGMLPTFSFGSISNADLQNVSTFATTGVTKYFVIPEGIPKMIIEIGPIGATPDAWTVRAFVDRGYGDYQ